LARELANQPTKGGKMIRINNIKANLDVDAAGLKEIVSMKTGLEPERIKSLKIAKKSVDARNKSNVQFVYALDMEVFGDEDYIASILAWKDIVQIKETASLSFATKPLAGGLRPVVAGTGPAGMFAGLALAEAGLRPILLERGKAVSERRKDVEAFWQTGHLKPESNVQFGEGGAGTFSDGKLMTGIKKDDFTARVLQELAAAGAPEEILYLAKPHIGTDKLAVVVRRIREKIISLGGEYRFENRLEDLIVRDGKLTGLKIAAPGGKIYEQPTDRLILAVGHSARDTFEMLHKNGVYIEQKPFSVGVRIEHVQKSVDAAQYGRFAGHPALGAADYKLAAHFDNGRSAYTFCMCPGGMVVAAASEPGRVVTNGMSEFARDGKNANAALLVGVEPRDFGSAHPLAGMYFQRRLEEAAFRAGGGDYRAPAQLVGDFLKKQVSTAVGNVNPSYRPGVRFADLSAVLPDFVTETMRRAIVEMDGKLRGFAAADAVLTGVETRSSSPIRIMRDEHFEANIKGLYPCGEGAGYAGGIVSSAVDGLKTCLAVI
jgi:hypothetical protein